MRRRPKEKEAGKKAKAHGIKKGQEPGVTLEGLSKFQEEARVAWRALPKAKRIRIRRKYKARRDHFSETDWWHKQQEAKRTSGDDPRDSQKEGRARRKGKTDAAVTITISRDKKRLDKHVRRAMEVPTTKKKPFVALLQPMVIVPDSAEGKVVVADAGSIVKLADMTTMYRNLASPITHRADEVLVSFGNAKAQSLGWISGRFATSPDEVMKPSKGPTFLVKTSGEDSLSAWDKLRLKVARTRGKDPANWIAPWLAYHGPKYPRELREVTRLFGGKPIKNEDVEARIERLFSLILHTELDMATAKSKKSKGKKSRSGVRKGKSARSEKREKRSSKSKKEKFSAKSDLITRKLDEHTIKRLVQENPFREGSNRAKLWSKLKKGMTVAEFVAKGDGRGRTELRHYRASGWVKLRRPAA